MWVTRATLMPAGGDDYEPPVGATPSAQHSPGGGHTACQGYTFTLLDRKGALPAEFKVHVCVRTELSLVS